MNVLKLLLIVGSIFVANSLYGQTTIKELRILYQYEGEYYNDKNIPSVLKANPESLELFRTYKTYKEVSYIFWGIGGVSTGILLHNEFRKKDLLANTYIPILMMGCIVTSLSAVVALSLKIQSGKKKREAINVFNTGVVKSLGSIYRPSLKLGTGQHGIGLILQF